LLINSQKSKVMIIHSNNKSRINLDSLNFSIDDDNLDVVDSYKYLGHIISNSLRTHNMMYEHLATQSQRAMHALKERIKSTVGYLPPKISIKMFDTHILPILDYNSEIWFSNKEIDVLERIQLKFLKNLLGVRNQTSSVAVLADTGRFPLIYRQQTSAIKYWDRLKSENCPLLLHNCYEIQLSLYHKNLPCWLTRLHKITSKLNINSDEIPASIITKLYEQAHSKIIMDINDNGKYPKLRTYKLFKGELRLESYLNYNLPKNLYRSIARFRLSSHNLYIELGRHKRPYVIAEERICKRCNINDIEDEFHCMVICTKWDAIRVDLYDMACKHIENFTVIHPKEQFLKIMINKNPELNYALGKFLNIVLKTDNII
jgi:hypothetical protein